MPGPRGAGEKSLPETLALTSSEPPTSRRYGDTRARPQCQPRIAVSRPLGAIRVLRLRNLLSLAGAGVYLDQPTATELP